MVPQRPARRGRTVRAESSGTLAPSGIAKRPFGDPSIFTNDLHDMGEVIASHLLRDPLLDAITITKLPVLHGMPLQDRIRNHSGGQDEPPVRVVQPLDHFQLIFRKNL